MLPSEAHEGGRKWAQCPAASPLPSPRPEDSPSAPERLQLLLFLASGKESGLRTKSAVQSALWKVLEESTRHLDCLDCSTELTGPAGVSAPGLAV